MIDPELHAAFPPMTGLPEDRPMWRARLHGPLADRRGMTTKEAWVWDPWMHRWLTLTALLMRHYRVAPRRLTKEPWRG